MNTQFWLTQAFNGISYGALLQQMLAIGRGLMTNPDCLIMDEPSEGLDRSSSRGCGKRSEG
jgi:ABC-type branched-subunit amino acid transport system ATPase component